jgi:hypothetical protein
MAVRELASVRVVLGYADATYAFAWRPAEPGLQIVIARDAADGDAGEFAVEVRRPADAAAIIGILRRTLALTPVPRSSASSGAPSMSSPGRWRHDRRADRTRPRLAAGVLVLLAAIVSALDASPPAPVAFAGIVLALLGAEIIWA